MHEKTIKSKRIYQGRLVGLRDDEVELSTGVVSHREICEHPGAVAVVALTEKNEIVLIRQFRKPAEQVLIEIPAGLFNKGEDFKNAALRELKEETGYIAKSIKHVLSVYTSPGYSTELLHFFLAKDLIKESQSYEEDEHIEVELAPVDKLSELVKEGKIKDSKTIIGLWIAENYDSKTPH